MGDRGLHVGLLGPTTLCVDGGLVEVPRRQVRRLLTVLAGSGAVVSSDSLIEFLWGDELPNDPRAALSVVLSRLRGHLGVHREALQAVAPGYRLDAAVDIDRFEALLAEARGCDDDGETVRCLSETLELWRGSPFGDDAELEVLRPGAARLGEAWWNANALLLEALHRLGRHGEVIELGAELHSSEPQRERVAIAVANSMARSGRRSDALDVIAACRRWLRDHVGLQAGSVLDAVEQEILRSATDITLRSPSPMPWSDPSTGRFVGRSELLDRLENHHAGAVVVVGEPGIGKTAVLRRYGAQRRASDSIVVHAVASPVADRPIAVVGDIVAQLVQYLDPAQCEPIIQAAFARAFPELVDHEDVEPGTQLEAVTRDALTQAFAAYIEAATQAAGAVVVLDDCHWIDRASLRVVERLVDSGVLTMVIATRPVDGDRFGGATVIELEPLDSSDVAALVHQSIPNRDSPELRELLEVRTGGNALFLSLLLDLLSEGEQLDEALPGDVLVAVRERLDSLSARARATMQAAAVVGTQVALSTLRQVSPTAGVDLREAEAVHLIEIDEAAEVARFRHALVAEAAYQMLGSGERVTLHDEIGELLEADGAPPAEFAHHYYFASELDPGRAAVALLEAAKRGAEVYSWDQVERLANQGLEFGAAGGGLVEARLAVLVGTSQRAMHRGGSDEALIRGAELARQADDQELFAEAAIALSVQNWTMTGEVNPAAVELLEAALASDLAPRSRALVCAAASTFAMSNQHERARELYHEALEIALTLHDPTTQAEVLRNCRWGLCHPDDLAALIEANTLLGDLSGGDPHLSWGAASNDYAIGSIVGNRAAVDEAFASLRSMHLASSDPTRDWEMAHIESSHALFIGDFDRCDEHMERALALGLTATSLEWLQPIYGALLTSARRQQGRLPEMLALLDQSIDARPDFLGWRSVAAAAAAAAGDEVRCRREFELVAADDFRDITPDQAWTGVMVCLSDAACFLGDRERAELLYAALAPYSGRMAWGGVSTAGPIDGALGDLAGVLGNQDSAEAHGQEAARLLSAARTSAVQ